MKKMGSIVKKVKETTLNQRIATGAVLFILVSGAIIAGHQNKVIHASNQNKVSKEVKIKVTNEAKKNIVNQDKPVSDTNTVLSASPVPNIEQSDSTAEIHTVVPSDKHKVEQFQFSSATVFAQTQYSHTENGHVEGAYYAIPSSQSMIATTMMGTIISGTVSRGGIGLEKGSILLNYVLNFDSTGNYVSGSVTSSGYVSTSLNLEAGQNYIGQSVNFITTTGGYAGSGSYIYPIIANITLT